MGMQFVSSRALDQADLARFARHCAKSGRPLLTRRDVAEARASITRVRK